MTALRGRVRDLESALADELLHRPGGRVFAAGGSGEVIPLRAGRRAQKQNQVVVWRPLRNSRVIGRDAERSGSPPRASDRPTP